MSDYWQEFLELLSDEELIRFERRAQMAGKPELAAQFEAKLAEFRQTELTLPQLKQWNSCSH
jgi:hypothetical protein